MTRDGQAPRDASIEQCVAWLAAAVDPQEVGVEMADHLTATLPELRLGDEDFRAVLIGSCVSNLTEILLGLAAGHPADQATPPPDATAWAHELVHRGIGLGTLLRTYRLGHEMLQERFEALAEELPGDPAVRIAALGVASRWFFVYVDAVSTQLVDVYEAEREQWMRGAAAAQSELIRRLVAGDPIDERGAEQVLGYPVAATHVAFIVWRAATTVRSEPPPATAARRFALALGGADTLVTPVGEHAAWAWTTGPSLAEPPARLEAEDAELTVAVGGAHQGIDGMRRALREAQEARRVGELLGRRPGAVLHFPALALTSLLTVDPARARDFSTAVLNGLGGDSDRVRRLRATLEVYVDERCSITATARRLGVHQNTVRYRIDRCEAVLGCSIEAIRLDLEVALRLFRTLPGAVEGPDL